MLPLQIVNELEKHSLEQSELSDKLVALEVAKIEHFNDHRKDYTSDQQCNMAFMRSTTGIEHFKTKSRLQLLGKEISLYKALLRNAENVARGLY